MNTYGRGVSSPTSPHPVDTPDFTSSTAPTLFPLPLLSPPPALPTPPSSRRARRARTLAAYNYAVANDVIRAVNTLHFNYPSATFCPPITRSSADPSLAQLRVQRYIVKAAASYLSSCRRAGFPAGTASDRLDSASTAHRADHNTARNLFIPPVSPSPSAGAASLAEYNISELDDPHFFPAASAFAQYDDFLSQPTPLPPSSYSSTTASIRRLVSDAVALPSNLQHVRLSSLLPPDVSAAYTTADALLLPNTQVQERLRAAGLRKPRAFADRSEYVRLVHRMLGLGMLSLTRSPRCVNGLFGTPKGEDRIRLILDARWANCYFVDPPHVTLPSPSHLAQLLAPPAGHFVTARMDLSNFYHQLLLPTWLRPYFALPSLEPHELALCPSLSEADRLLLQDPSPIFPCCTTLPMGFSHSVFLAQCVHEHILYSFARLPPADNILNLTSPLISRPIHCVYIDDLVFLAPNDGSCPQQYQAALCAYRQAGLPPENKKCEPPSITVKTVLGVDLDGGRSRIALSPLRHSKVVAATTVLLRSPTVTGRELSAVLGSWTWQMLLRRPTLSALKHAYHFVEKYPNTRKSLWPSVRRELHLLLALAPLLFADLRSPLSRHVIATDSSSTGSGVVTTRLTRRLYSVLWPCSTHAPRSLLPLDPASFSPRGNPLVTQLVQPALCLPLAPGRIRYMSELEDRVAEMQLVLGSARWSTVVASPWQRQEHINLLELRSVLTSLRWHLSHPDSASERLFLLTDSSVVYFGLRKGRSSSPALLLLLRRCASLLLASGLDLLPIWIPSAVNPADRPSRNNTPPYYSNYPP